MSLEIISRFCATLSAIGGSSLFFDFAEQWMCRCYLSLYSGLLVFFGSISTSLVSKLVRFFADVGAPLFCIASKIIINIFDYLIQSVGVGDM